MTKLVGRIWPLLFVTQACNTFGGGSGEPGKNKQPLLAEAQSQYVLTRQTASHDVSGQTIGTGTPVEITVTTWEMHKNSQSPEKHHWVGAFETSVAYPALGFGQGRNYVFLLDSGDENHRYVVVPEQSGLDPHYLTYDPNLHLSGNVADPPLAVRSKRSSGPAPKGDAFQIGGCLEGPCSTGHCSTTGVGAAYLGT